MKKILALTLAGALSSAAYAAPETYVIEPSHTLPRFEYSHFGYSIQLSRFDRTSGTITLEISNLNRLPVALYPGMRVCQIAFEQMSSPAAVPYYRKPGSKYQGQVLPEESRLAMDVEFAAGNQ